MERIKELCARFEPVGSRITCNPAPTDTDEDFLLLAKPGDFALLVGILMDEGWELGGSEIPNEYNSIEPESRFQSFTYGDKNLIITESNVFFRRFMAATSVCKRLNLMEKTDRIALFQAVLYANTMEENNV